MALRWISCALAAALFLGACGDDDTTTDAGDEPTTAATDEMSDDEISDDEMSDDEMSDDEMSDDEMSDDEMSDDEMSDDEMDGMDHDGMDMGSAEATPADAVDGAELATGAIELLPTAPEGHEDAAGTVDIARSDAGTTVTVAATGLVPGTEYLSHVHEGACDDNGGAHYKFDPAGGDEPPNEIHLRFTADDDGAVTWTAANEMTAGPEAVTWVMHLAEDTSVYVACATFE